MQLRSASETKSAQKNANVQQLKKRGQSIGNSNQVPSEILTDQPGSSVEFDPRNESPTKFDPAEPN